MTSSQVAELEATTATADRDKTPTSGLAEQSTTPVPMSLDTDSQKETPTTSALQSLTISSTPNPTSEAVSPMNLSTATDTEKPPSPPTTSSTEPQADSSVTSNLNTASSQSPMEPEMNDMKMHPDRKMMYGLPVKKKKKAHLASSATESSHMSPAADSAPSRILTPAAGKQRNPSDSGSNGESAAKNGSKNSSPATSVDSEDYRAKHLESEGALSREKAPSRRSQAFTENSEAKAKTNASRKNTPSQDSKPLPKAPPGPTELVEATKEASATFEVIEECIYLNKRLADADQDGEIMQCECRANWNGEINTACSENSDCINRATKIECSVEDCPCGPDCQNMRFQRRQYADVSVVKAAEKGYGLRANATLHANDFISEYVGEVIDEPRYMKRRELYYKAGIKHFYFMSLKSGEFIDATKKGGYSRFCNHSCNPNCYVDKWVVGDKLRMGIFAKRDIRPGEELVFDYNVDRYGSDPVKCYCGEPNCVGFISGRTQTNARLSHHVIEALGLEGDEVYVGKKSRKPRKTGEEDSEYTENIPTKQMGETDVTKVMSTLLHCKERWIIHKLLSRIDRSQDEAVFPRVVRLHGYQVLGRILHEYKQDEDMVLLALGILIKFPRMTKNKITSSRIEPTVQELAKSENERIRTESSNLLQLWNALQTAFRIPRRVGQAPVGNIYNERGRKSRSKSKSPDRPAPPTGPKSLQHAPPVKPPPSGMPPKRVFRDLPWGWHKTWTSNQQVYYYANDGTVTWWKPSASCESKARLNSIPPPPTIPYVPLEREPLPENIAASERARKDKEFRVILQREMEEEMRKREEELEKRREQAREEEKRKEEEEKAIKKQRAKERKEYERTRRRDHIETYIRKDFHTINGKYLARFLAELPKPELTKWHNKVDDILVAKAMRSISTSADVTEERQKLFERKHLDKLKIWLQDYCTKLLERRAKALKKSKPESITPVIESTTPPGDPTPFVSSLSTTPALQDDTPAESVSTTTPPDKVAPTNGNTPEEVKETRKRAREDDNVADSPKRRKSPVEA